MKILCRRGKFKDTEEVIRYPPLGIGLGTDDIVFGISVPENTTSSPKYRNTEFHSVFLALLAPKHS